MAYTRLSTISRDVFEASLEVNAIFNALTDAQKNAIMDNAVQKVATLRNSLNREDYQADTITADINILPGFGFDDDDFLVKDTIDSVATIVGKSVAEVKILLGMPDAISKTYAELTAMISGSTLAPGQPYLITDYASVHTIPTTAVTNTPTAEPLIVRAISTNKLSPIAFSPTFPQDVIYYEVTSDQAMVPGCTKGYIYRRVDTQKNNDIGFDYRNVKFRRWQISVTTSDTTGAVANYTKGNVVLKTGTAEIYIKLNNATAELFTNTSAWKRFEWDNLQYVSPTITNWVIINLIDQITINVTIPCSALYMDYKMFTTAATAAGVESAYTTIYNNKISQNSSDILTNANSVFIGTGFYRNTIGMSFYNNTIGYNFYRNSIGNNFNANSIGYGFIDNVIGYEFTNSTIGNTFNTNIVVKTFHQNVIGNNFSNNTLGYGFFGNLVGGSFTSNNIRNYFYYNIIGGSFARNNTDYYFGALDLTAATHVYAAYPKWWFKTPDGTKKLYYFADSTFAMTIVDVTA